MLTVKAFHKTKNGRLYCHLDYDSKRLYYEIGKTYQVPIEKVKMCKYGFHASAHCDISETLDYCLPDYDVVYALVDINVIYEKWDKVVGDRITVVKELSFDECIDFDRTGKWCERYAEYVNGADIEKLQKAVIEKDQTGEWCVEFAERVKGADIEKLQAAVIEKDDTGRWCTWFAYYVSGADVKKLQDEVIRKDKTGEWCMEFAERVKGADIEKLQTAVIEKDQTGEWCMEFALNVRGAYTERLKNAVRQKKIIQMKGILYFPNTVNGKKMLTIKAFHKAKDGRLYCQPDYNFERFYYEIGKTYEVPTEKVKMCKYGFHASAHCDISETLRYYNVSSNTVYCLVDLNAIDIQDDKAVGDKITIIRELSLDECIQYDRTGEWCAKYAEYADEADVEKLQTAVIEKDKTGEYCTWFAERVEGANIKKLQKTVIEKDDTGEWCMEFAERVEGADIEKLQKAVIEKDKMGVWCYWFDRCVPGADVKKLQSR